MSFVAQRRARGLDNRAAGSAAGPENLISPGVRTPLQPIVTSELGTAVSSTIARALDVATVTATAHGLLPGNLVRIAGAVETEFNGDFLVRTVADANTFTYDVYSAVITNPATGTITSRKIV